MASKEAREFDTGTAYATGDLVLHAGRLYRFTANHSAGAWNSSQVTAVDSNYENRIERILAGMDNAADAADFVNTLVFEPEQITGTRYKYILTNAVDPRE